MSASDHTNVTDEWTKYVRKSVALSNKIPEDLAFYTSSYKDIAKSVRDCEQKAISSLNSLLNVAKDEYVEETIVISDAQDLAERYNEVWVDILDSIFERVNMNIDALTKMATSVEVVQADVGGTCAVKFSNSNVASEKNTRDNRFKVIPKPQVQFADVIDNSDEPFVPKIEFKPNALKPLKLELSEGIPEHLNAHVVSLGKAIPKKRYLNPYKYEIENANYPKHMLTNMPEILYKPLDETQCTFVDTVDALEDMKITLDAQQEIAIDLEHHDYRSYQGITCLMQISTREEDFIIDTLKLRAHMNILNSSFTNPAIVKVLHGAEYDIKWMQRDFGLYIVNLFDTYHACSQLNFPKKSLAYLVDYYVGISLNKKFQTADWRMRPLTESMLKYAQEDTHYLLYIYDRLRNQLSSLGGNEYSLMLAECAKTCLKTYEKPVYSDDAYLKTLYRYRQHAFTAKDLSVFKALHRWRDETARKEDESPNYVISNHNLFGISIAAPQTVAALLEACHPVPPMVRVYSKELVEVIKKGASSTTEDEHSLDVQEEIARAKSIDKSIETQNLELRHLRFSDESDEEMKVVEMETIEQPQAEFDETRIVLIDNNAILHKSKPLPKFQSKLFSEENPNENYVFKIPPDAHFLLSGNLDFAESSSSSESEDGSEIGEEVSKECSFAQQAEVSQTSLSESQSERPTADSKPMEEDVIVLGKMGFRKPTSNTAQLINLSGKKRKRRGKKLKDSNNEESLEKIPKVEEELFDPFTKVVEDEKLKRKDARLNNRSKHGNRQITFRKPK